MCTVFALGSVRCNIALPGRGILRIHSSSMALPWKNIQKLIIINIKMIYCLYEDSNRDIRSNIDLRLWELPLASPSGTSSGKGLYLTVYPSSRPNRETLYQNVDYQE